MNRRERWIFAGLVLLSAVIVSRGSHGMSGAAPHYLAVSHSIAHDIDLDVRNQYAADGGYLFQPATTTTEGVSRVGRNGGLYPTDGLGFSAAMVPVFVAVDAITAAMPESMLTAVRWNRERAARDLISIVMAVLAAWTAVLTVRLTTVITGREGGAVSFVVIAFATLPLLGASILAFVEIPAALLCLWFVLERTRPAPRTWVMALPLALLPWLHLRYVVIAIAGAMWALAQEAGPVDRARRVPQALVIPAVSLIVLGVWRWWLFGTLLPDLPADAGWMTLAALATGLPGLLLDVDFGLLWVAPFWCVSLLGISRVRHALPGFARFTGRTIVGVLVVAAAFGTWREFGPPAREWVPLLPLLAPFCLEGFQRLARTSWRWIAFGGVAWAAAVSLLVLARPGRQWTEPGAGLGRMPASAIGRLTRVYSAPSRLERMGLPLTDEAFVGRVEAGDLASVDLFLKSGFGPESAIVAAVRAGRADVLARLLDAGLAPGPEVARALVWAERRADEGMAAALRAAGARLDMTSARGETALMAAVISDRPDELDMLLESGIDVNATTRAGQTALAFAVGASRREMVRRLIAAGADVDVADADGWTPLLVAVRRADPDVVQALLDAGADVNAMSRLGWTALMWAALDGTAGIVRDLLAAGADVDLTSKAGQSALIRAAGQGHSEVVQLLVDADADVTAQVDGADARAWAARNGHTAVADRLQRSGGRP